MSEFLIGAGGWAYFQVPGLRPLEAYSKAFNFVEVNSTFYQLPNLNLVETWRKRVPPDFEFSVRCHKGITHKHQLEASPDAFKVFNSMTEICSLLNARFLVLETPPSIIYNEKKIEAINNFFENIDLGGIQIVWEIRRRKGEPIPSGLVSLMQDHNVIHCVDLSKENPSVESEVTYTRVFGKGRHNIYQFTDNELVSLDEKMSNTGSSSIAVSFHNVKMYKDAARFKFYKETGNFPSVTGTEGRSSLEKVLREDAKFPITKQELMQDQGWKVIDLTYTRRVHASHMLEKLPDIEFSNIEEVLTHLRDSRY